MILKSCSAHHTPSSHEVVASTRPLTRRLPIIVLFFRPGETGSYFCFAALPKLQRRPRSQKRTLPNVPLEGAWAEIETIYGVYQVLLFPREGDGYSSWATGAFWRTSLLSRSSTYLSGEERALDPLGFRRLHIATELAAPAGLRDFPYGIGWVELRPSVFLP